MFFLFLNEKSLGNSLSCDTLCASLADPKSVALIPDAVHWRAVITTKKKPNKA